MMTVRLVITSLFICEGDIDLNSTQNVRSLNGEKDLPSRTVDVITGNKGYGQNAWMRPVTHQQTTETAIDPPPQHELIPTRVRTTPIPLT